MSRNKGFTLLEILMAIAIFAIVISIAYSSYNASFHIINGAESQSEVYAQARTAMTRIQEDLESFYPGESPLFQGTSETLNGHRADGLEFSSTANVQLHPWQVSQGHSIITYNVKEDPEAGTLKLYRSQRPAMPADQENTDPEANALLLCDTLLEVAFDYRNKDGEEKETWGDVENDSATILLPELIRITLRFAGTADEEEGLLFQTALILPTSQISK